MKNLIAALVLSVLSLSVNAEEMFVRLDTNVNLVISSAPCEKFKPETTSAMQLNYAYAINLDTQEKVTGCFTHHGDIIEIELTDEESKEFYHYKVHASKFLDNPVTSSK